MYYEYINIQLVYLNTIMKCLVNEPPYVFIWLESYIFVLLSFLFLSSISIKT